jgi:uncharacterized tellurite resistance protein B-like protein
LVTILENGSPTRIDRLRIAFAVRVARRIVDADGVLDLSEIELLARTFPSALLHRAGFLDRRDLLTPAVDRAYREALAELPGVLTLTEKLDLVTLFHRTCDADGDIHPRELDVLRDAAAMLAVPRRTLDRHLSTLWSGTIVPIERR